MVNSKRPWEGVLEFDGFLVPARIAFHYDREDNVPVNTTAKLLVKVGPESPWAVCQTGHALLHPADVGKFRYDTGRKLAVKRLIEGMVPELRPQVAKLFFGSRA